MKKYLFLPLLLSILSANGHAAGNGAASGSGYFSFENPFVVNIMDNNRMRFLQIAMQMQLVDPNTAADITRHRDAIRHNVIMLLSAQEAQDLYSITGKERLRRATLKEIKAALKGRADHVEIEDIFFTSFIIQ
ncbi:flagellar basal body-associated FliL family protein [Sulfuriflexus sp.]|uniref:flagellar basal body-associated FliL family protein n=1 Tax=Sulfuriflexus sp. TaxID=2015443 RepID=UPI0028CD4B69|nr:flagellar basal body-associated FliL family protein [Sulfuriflexus sp.]MDT8405524.1 flagellar basal body-associated FliL family protein [Sulfuriflexus sp.]